MTQHSQQPQVTPAVTDTAERQTRALAVAVPLFLGCALVFITGFAHPQALHDAAHDTRHALSFPCH